MGGHTLFAFQREDIQEEEVGILQLLMLMPACAPAPASLRIAASMRLNFIVNFMSSCVPALLLLLLFIGVALGMSSPSLNTQQEHTQYLSLRSHLAAS